MTSTLRIRNLLFHRLFDLRGTRLSLPTYTSRRGYVSNNIIRSPNTTEVSNHGTGSVANNAAAVISTPPMPIRAALVGTSVGLGTPFFAIAGVADIWYRYMPSTLEGKLIKYLIGVILGGGGGVLIWDHVLPFMGQHSEFILPFALANGITATFWYTLGELTVGLERMIGGVGSTALATGLLTPTLTKRFFSLAEYPFLRFLPLAGGVLGALTAITTQFLWEPIMSLCWSEELCQLILDKSSSDLKDSWIKEFYGMLLWPVVMPVGIFAGSTLHFLLKPVVVGTPGIAWTSRSLPVLLGIVGVSAAYFTLCGNQENWWWHLRVDPKTGQIISHNTHNDQILFDDGKLGRIAQTKRNVLEAYHVLRKFYISIREDFIKMFNAARDTEDNVMASPSTATPSKEGNSSEAVQVGRYRFPRQPRHLAQSSASLHTSYDYDVLYSLIDKLLRLKHMNMELQKLQQMHVSSSSPLAKQPNTPFEQLSRERAEFIQSNRYIISNLEETLQACEIGAVANSARCPVEMDKINILKSVQRKLKKQVVPPNQWKLFSNPQADAAERNAYALALIQENFEIFEKELMRSLHVDVVAEHAVAAMRSFQRQESLQTIAIPASILAVAAAALTFFWSSR